MLDTSRLGTSTHVQRHPSGGSPGCAPGRSTTTIVASSRTSSHRSQVRSPAAASAPRITNSSRLGSSAQQGRQRVGGVGRSARVDLEPAGLEADDVGHRGLHHRRSAPRPARPPGCRPSATGTLLTTSSTRSRRSSWRTFTADTRWPTCGGSKVPPKTPRRSPPPCRSLAIPETYALRRSRSRRPAAGDIRHPVNRNRGATWSRCGHLPYGDGGNSLPRGRCPGYQSLRRLP